MLVYSLSRILRDTASTFSLWTKILFLSCHFVILKCTSGTLIIKASRAASKSHKLSQDSVETEDDSVGTVIWQVDKCWNTLRNIKWSESQPLKSFTTLMFFVLLEIRHNSKKYSHGKNNKVLFCFSFVCWNVVLQLHYFCYEHLTVKYKDNS